MVEATGGTAGGATSGGIAAETAAGDEAAAAAMGEGDGGVPLEEAGRDTSPLSGGNLATIDRDLRSLSSERGDVAGRGDAARPTLQRGGAPGAPPGEKSFWDKAKAQWRERGYINLSDKTVTSFADAALVAQVFRDPRVEHSRLLYVGAKSGKVLAHEGFTARLADAAPSPLYAGYQKGQASEAVKEVNVKKMAKRVNRLSSLLD